MSQGKCKHEAKRTYNRIKKQESRDRRKNNGFIHISEWVKATDRDKVLDFIAKLNAGEENGN